MQTDLRRAVSDREAADGRVRRVTIGLVVVGAALTAALTAVAGSATHLRKAVTTRSSTTPARAVKPVVAPAPPVVSIQAPATTSAAPPPAPAPAPAPAPVTPVVVSGGS